MSVLIGDQTAYALHFDPQGPLLAATLECEKEVFADRYGDDPQALADYIAPYAGSSTFLCIADGTGAVAAMARLVHPSPAGLATLVDVAGDPWWADAEAAFAQTGLDPARTWDLASVVVRKASSGQSALFAAAIYHGLIKALQANRVTGFVAELDVRVRRVLNMLGVVLHPLPGVEPMPYWGSPSCAPSYAHLDALLDQQRRTSPDAYRLVTLGIGLDGIRVPPNDAFVLHRPRVVQLPHQAPVSVDLRAATAEPVRAG